jgi:hypothetical protein
MRSKSSEMVELSTLTTGQQLQFVRDYCDQHPDKRYIEAVLALIQGRSPGQNAFSAWVPSIKYPDTRPSVQPAPRREI